MRYDPSREALFTPEAQGPLFGAPGNWTRDAICAELSRLAYIRFDENSLQDLEQALAGAGFQPPVTFVDEELDAEGYGTIGPDGTVYVVFRGTQSDKRLDLICDADVVPVAGPGGSRVHRGFMRAVESLDPAIDAWLAGHRGARLVATGHSLGAAMATLLAARIESMDLVTFGSPRVGNEAFANLFAGRDVRRYVDCCDVVTTVPPPFGYRHLEGERYIDRFGRLLARSPGEIARVQDRSLAALTYLRRCSGRPGNVTVRDLADHAPVNYLSALLGVRQGP